MLGYQTTHPFPFHTPMGQYQPVGEVNSGMDYMAAFGLSHDGHFIDYTPEPTPEDQAHASPATLGVGQPLYDFPFTFNPYDHSSLPVDGYPASSAGGDFQPQSQSFELGGTDFGDSNDDNARSTDDSTWWREYLENSGFAEYTTSGGATEIADGPFVADATPTPLAPVENAFEYNLVQDAYGAQSSQELGTEAVDFGALASASIDTNHDQPSGSTAFPQLLDFPLPELETPSDLGIYLKYLEELSSQTLPAPSQAHSGHSLSTLSTTVTSEPLHNGSWVSPDGQFVLIQPSPVSTATSIAVPWVSDVLDYQHVSGAQPFAYQVVHGVSGPEAGKTPLSVPTTTASAPSSTTTFVHYRPRHARTRANAQAGPSTRVLKRPRQDAEPTIPDDGKAARNVRPRTEEFIYYIRCAYPSHEGSTTRCGEYITDRPHMHNHLIDDHPDVVAAGKEAQKAHKAEEKRKKQEEKAKKEQDQGEEETEAEEDEDEEGTEEEQKGNAAPHFKPFVCGALVPYQAVDAQGDKVVVLRPCGRRFKTLRALAKHIFVPLHRLGGGKQAVDRDGKAIGAVENLHEAMFTGCALCNKRFEEYLGGEGSSATRHATPSTKKTQGKRTPACPVSTGTVKAQFKAVAPSYRPYKTA